MENKELINLEIKQENLEEKNKIERIGIVDIEERKKYIDKGLIYIEKIYEKLTQNEKNIDTYSEKLKQMISNKNKLKIGNYIPLFTAKNYLLLQELNLRKEFISKIKTMKKSFSYFKQEERKSINRDFSITEEEKETLKKVLDVIIKERYKKLDYALKKFQAELNGYKKMIELDENMNIKDKTVSDITEYLANTYQNIMSDFENIEIKKQKKLKKLSQRDYLYIIEETLSKITTTEQHSSELTMKFINEFNKNVELENAKQAISI